MAHAPVVVPKDDDITLPTKDVASTVVDLSLDDDEYDSQADAQPREIV